MFATTNVLGGEVRWSDMPVIPNAIQLRSNIKNLLMFGARAGRSNAGIGHAPAWDAATYAASHRARIRSPDGTR